MEVLTCFGSRTLAQGIAIVLQVFKALRGGVQVVAVKVLHDAEVGGMNFVREIAILKGCRHTNIVQFQVSAQSVSALPFQVVTCAAVPDSFFDMSHGAS